MNLHEYVKMEVLTFAEEGRNNLVVVGPRGYMNLIGIIQNGQIVFLNN